MPYFIHRPSAGKHASPFWSATNCHWFAMRFQHLSPEGTGETAMDGKVSGFCAGGFLQWASCRNSPRSFYYAAKGDKDRASVGAHSVPCPVCPSFARRRPPWLYLGGQGNGRELTGHVEPRAPYTMPILIVALGCRCCRALCARVSSLEAPHAAPTAKMLQSARIAHSFRG